MSQATIDQTPIDADQAEFDADMARFRGLLDAIEDQAESGGGRPRLFGFGGVDTAPGAAYLDWPVDRAAELLDDWRYGPVTHGAYCPCGSRLEIRGELDAEDYEAINYFDYVHQDCTADQDEAVSA